MLSRLGLFPFQALNYNITILIRPRLIGLQTRLIGFLTIGFPTVIVLKSLCHLQDNNVVLPTSFHLTSFGDPGVNGTDGVPGVNGMNGKPGIDGMDGAPGPKGRPQLFIKCLHSKQSLL